MNLIREIVLFTLFGIIAARLATEPFDQQLIEFKNYGLYLKPQRAVRPVNHRWYHTYAIPIPILPKMENNQGQSTKFCTGSDLDQERIQCNALLEFKKAIYDVEMKAYEMLNESYSEFKNAFATEVRDIHDVRTRRAWFDIVGKGLSMAFGVATHKDMDQVYNTIKEVRKSQVEGFQAISNVSSNLASFMRIAQTNFDTIFKTFETFNRLSEEYNKGFGQNRQLIYTMQDHITFILRQSVEFSSELYYITHFRTALYAALQGKITPDLIQPQIIQDTIDIIMNKLSTLQTSLFLVQQTPQAIYAGGEFTLFRDRDQLYVTIAFAISPISTTLTVYQTLCTPTPLPNDSHHVTMLQNIPPFVALSQNQEFYMTFDSNIGWESQSSVLSLDRIAHVLHHKQGPSCLASFINNQLHLIPKRCSFALLPNAAESQIFHLEMGHLLLINISEYKLHCLNGSVITVHPEIFVEVILPCECSLESQYGNYYSRLVQCEQEQEALTQIYPVNRIALQTWFYEDRLVNISANSGYKRKPIIPTAKLQAYQSEYTQQINTLQKTALSLDALVNNTQGDTVFYQSLAHKLAFDLTTDKITITATYLKMTSWQNVLNMISTLGTIACATAIVILYRKHSALVATLAIPKTTAMPVNWIEGDLSYLVPTAATTQTETAMPQIVKYEIPLLDIFICLVLSAILGLLIYHWVKQQVDPLKTFVIYLEVTNTVERIHIPVATLPTASNLYKFLRGQEEPQITVQGQISPILVFQNSPVKIIYSPSNWQYYLPKQISLNWIQAARMRKILASVQPHVLVFFLWERYTFELVPIKFETESN